MTVEQAIALLDRVLQNVSGTRADHMHIIEALEVIRKATAPEALNVVADVG